VVVRSTAAATVNLLQHKNDPFTVFFNRAKAFASSWYSPKVIHAEIAKLLATMPTDINVYMVKLEDLWTKASISVNKADRGYYYAMNVEIGLKYVLHTYYPTMELHVLALFAKAEKNYKQELLCRTSLLQSIDGMKNFYLPVTTLVEIMSKTLKGVEPTKPKATTVTVNAIQATEPKQNPTYAPQRRYYNYDNSDAPQHQLAALTVNRNRGGWRRQGWQGAQKRDRNPIITKGSKVPVYGPGRDFDDQGNFVPIMYKKGIGAVYGLDRAQNNAPRRAMNRQGQQQPAKRDNRGRFLPRSQSRNRPFNPNFNYNAPRFPNNQRNKFNKSGQVRRAPINSLNAQPDHAENVDNSGYINQDQQNVQVHAVQGQQKQQQFNQPAKFRCMSCNTLGHGWARCDLYGGAQPSQNRCQQCNGKHSGRCKGKSMQVMAVNQQPGNRRRGRSNAQSQQ
jgi:hypothetical protein